MDEKADAGHDQQHDQRELVECEGIVDSETAGAQPRRHGLNVRQRQGRELCGHPQRHEKSCAAKRQRDRGY